MRQLGRAGIAVSPLTLGTGGIGACDDMAEARAAFAMALEAGVNAIELAADDEAAVAFLADIQPGRDIHLLVRAASLVPFDLPSPHILADAAYPGRHLRAQVEALLRTLGVERLGLVQLHAWCPEWLHEGDWRETLEGLRAAGKIAGIGLSLFDHDVDAGLEAVSAQAVDAVQVMHNIFDPAAADRLLPLASAREVGSIARAPLYYGALASPPFAGGFAVDDWRQAYFYDGHRAEAIARAQRVEKAVPGPLAETALRFSLSDPGIATVVTGLRTRAHVAAALRAVAAGPLDGETLAALSAHRWLC